MRPRRSAGFTLVELLVAISILALIAVLGWRGLDGIVRARVALSAQLEQSRGLQLAFAQMQSDCERLAGAGVSVTMLHGRANLAADTDRLTLIRTVFAENEASQLQVIAYRVKDGVLSRRESIATRDLVQLDALWQATLGDTDNAPNVILQNAVAGLAVRIWSAPAWSLLNGQAGSPAPTGLEVALQLKGQDISLVKVFLLGAG